MGNVAGYRAQWIQAEAYRRKWDKWNTDKKGDAPARDLGMETLAEVLRGNIFVHNHCYNADEMAQMIDIAKEFGYSIRSFHHVIEAYKIGDLLAKNEHRGVGLGRLGRLQDGSARHRAGQRGDRPHRAAAARSSTPTARPTRSASIRKRPRRWRRAIAAGLKITPEDAIKWITLNPAWALGLDDKIGSLAPGKNADLVLWSGNPVQRLHAHREGLDRRRSPLRSQRARHAVAHRLRTGLHADDGGSPMNAMTKINHAVTR